MPKKGVNNNKLRPWDHKYDITIHGRNIRLLKNSFWDTINDDDYFEVIIGGEDNKKDDDYEETNTLANYFPLINVTDNHQENDDGIPVTTNNEETNDNDDYTSTFSTYGIRSNNPSLDSDTSVSVSVTSSSDTKNDAFSHVSVPLTGLSSTSSTSSSSSSSSSVSYVTVVPSSVATVDQSKPSMQMRVMPMPPQNPATNGIPATTTSIHPSTGSFPTSSSPTSTIVDQSSRIPPFQEQSTDLPPVLVLPSASVATVNSPRPVTPLPPYHVPLIAFHVGREGTSILKQTKEKAFKGLHERYLIRFIIGRGNVIMCPLQPVGSIPLSPSSLSPTGTSAIMHSSGLNRTGSSGTLTSTVNNSVQLNDPQNHFFATMEGIRKAILDLVFNNTANISPIYTGTMINQPTGTNYTLTTVVPESVVIQLDAPTEQYFLENGGEKIRELITKYTDVQLIFHQNMLTIAPLCVGNRFVQRSRIEDFYTAPDKLLLRKNDNSTISIIDIVADDVFERLRNYREAGRQARLTPVNPDERNNPSLNSNPSSPPTVDSKVFRRFGC